MRERKAFQRWIIGAFFMGILLAVPLSVMALPVTYTFTNVTGNDPTDAQIGEDQMRMIVSDSAGGGDTLDTQALFTFTNLGPEASSITDIYFDDGTLLGINSIDNSDPGVQFSEGASPPNLPGGMQPSVMFSADFSADPDPPVQPNGINPGETLGILFDLVMGQTVQDVLDALDLGLTDPQNSDALRVGFHVQGYDSGGSESFVNNGGNGVQVPEASSMVLLGICMGGLFGARKKIRM